MSRFNIEVLCSEYLSRNFLQSRALVWAVPKTLQILIWSNCSIDGTFSDGAGRMMNDGARRERNARTSVLLVDNLPHLCFYALRDVMKGEHITYDYGVSGLPWRKVNTLPWHWFHFFEFLIPVRLEIYTIGEICIDGYNWRSTISEVPNAERLLLKHITEAASSFEKAAVEAHYFSMLPWRKIASTESTILLYDVHAAKYVFIIFRSGHIDIFLLSYWQRSKKGIL